MSELVKGEKPGLGRPFTNVYENTESQCTERENNDGLLESQEMTAHSPCEDQEREDVGLVLTCFSNMALMKYSLKLPLSCPWVP